MFDHAMRRRIQQFTLASMLSVAAMLCSVAAASATGTVSLSSDSTVLSFTGGAGDSSSLTVTYEAFAYVLQEATTPLTVPAQNGCVSNSATRVTCPSVQTLRLALDMGDYYDKVTMGPASAIPSYVESTVNNVGPVVGGDGPMVINSTDGCSNEPLSTKWVAGGSNYDTITVDGADCNIDGGAKDDQITITNSVPHSPNPDNPDDDHDFWYSVSGGDGADVIDASASTGNLKYNPSLGTDILLSGEGNDEINFGMDQDLIFGNGGNDRFYDDGYNGTAEANLSEVWGGPGNDTLSDMHGNQAEVTHFEGGPGTDRVTYLTNSSQPTHVSLDTAVDDGLILPGGGSEGDHIHPSVENIGNNPQIPLSVQFGGDDQLIGSPRANVIYSGSGNDLVDSKEGNDIIDGSYGNDNISGGSGDDKIWDLYGSNTLAGGDGNDVIINSGGDDSIDGGLGTDRVEYQALTSGVTVNLGTSGSQNTGGGGTDDFAGIEDLTGSAMADTITGSSVPNKIIAGGGNDTINTTDSSIDTITCGTGTDTVDANTTDVITDPAACENVTLH
jgi:Ca2+-binding RTX toxin-like protein